MPMTRTAPTRPRHRLPCQVTTGAHSSPAGRRRRGREPPTGQGWWYEAYGRHMIERAPFGRTGHQSSRVVFGAAALGGMRQERADELLPVLLEFGINHLDTAAAYGDSELRL